MDETVTLAEPREYFRLLDQASMSHWWGRSIEYVERRWLRQAMTLTGMARPHRWDWLDIGCGTGTRLRLWGDWNCWNRRVGVEPEVEAFRCASADSSIEFRSGGLPDLPVADSRFDVITAFDVLQHVEPERRKDAIRSMAQCLNDRGILLIRTNAPAIAASSRRDETIVDPAWLRRSLLETGLKIDRSSRFNMCGGIAEDVLKSIRKRQVRTEHLGQHRIGLPNSWKRRPSGHFLAAWCGSVESRILGTGLVNFPVGHSYLIMAIKDGDHDRTANG